MNNECLHLLIVEDEAAHVEAIRRAFDMAGAKVDIHAVATLREYRERVATHPPDFAIVDLNLPDGRATEILTHPSEDGPFPILVTFPILVMSAFGNQQIVVEVMKAGALDYVVKSPEAFDAMPQIVERAFREWDLLQKQKQTADAVVRAREHYQRLLEMASDGIHILDQEGALVEASPSFYRMLGYAPENPPPLNVKDWVAQWSPGQLKARIASYIKMPAIFETRHRRQDGQIIEVEIHVHGALIEGQQYLYASSRDITERKRADESHRRLAMAAEQAAETIIITDLHGTILYANPAFEKISGYSCAEVLGKNPSILKSDRHDAAFYRQMWETLTRGETWNGHLVNRRKDGTFYEEESTISPVHDAAGQVVNYVAVKHDVTREIQREAQLRQAQKMEAIGTLAGGVANDFNNILAIIQMLTGLMKSDGGLSAAQSNYTDEINASVDRAAALTRQLLLFSRKKTLQPHDLDLNQSVNNLAKMLRRTLGENIEMQIKLAPHPLFTHADEGTLDQVLINLAVNARDAMPKGGHLIIETSGVEFDESSTSQSLQGRPGSFVCLSVSDTGCGIPAENMPKIFEPFYTTKDVGKGTGLGLATIFGIVQQHQGWINAYSEPGLGTTFRIYLPRLSGVAGIKAAQPPPRPAQTGHETILLVEDEPALRATIRKVLTRLGYHILEAPTGVKALGVWKEHHKEIRLLLTDMLMPDGMTGKDLGQRLLEDNPELKVIYMSGYSAEVVGRDFHLEEGINFLTKPFEVRILAQTIRASLDKPNPQSGKIQEKN